MAKITTPVKIKLNREFKGRVSTINVDTAGSFMAVRIEDPEGIVSVKVATEVARRAGELLAEHNLIDSKDQRHISFGYHFDGVVINWLRH